MYQTRTCSKIDPALLVSLGIAAVLLFLGLGTIPGLHGDEAWVGCQIHDILGGARPVLGMNGYTGTAHEYLAAPFLRVFGFHVWALRFFGAFVSLGCVWLYFMDVRILFERRIAACATLLLVSMPFFMGFQRIANEVFMLNPVLALGSTALALNASSRENPRTRTLLHFANGVLLGLGLWNHLIFLSFVLSLGVAALYRKGRALFTKSPLYWSVAGILSALSPRILHQLRSHEALGQTPGMSSGGFHEFLAQLWERARVWPATFGEIAHGDFLFQRFTGVALIPTPNYTAVLLVAGIAVAVFAAFSRKKPDSRTLSARIMLIFTACLLATTLLISPRTADRYFLLLLYLVPLYVALLLDKLATKISKRVVYGLLGILIALNLFRIGVNYFYSFSQSGGRTSMLWLAGYAETSNHYVDTEALYKRLLALGAKQVCAEFLITQPLEFRKLSGEGSFDLSWDEKSCLEMASRNEPGVFGVVYNGGYRTMEEDKFPGFGKVFEDTHFIVLAKKPTK